MVAIQVAIDLAMWYFALYDAYSGQVYWAVLLAVNLILFAMVILVMLRSYIGEGVRNGQ
ncbi:MAG: hypothetical protein M1304_01470 [Candidatus Thermoplasmatota archaeon]|nr:hypothetical protein [Candidatus Thermoplasmatota archaeon]